MINNNNIQNWKSLNFLENRNYELNSLKLVVNKILQIH